MRDRTRIFLLLVGVALLAAGLVVAPVVRDLYSSREPLDTREAHIAFDQFRVAASVVGLVLAFVALAKERIPGGRFLARGLVNATIAGGTLFVALAVVEAALYLKYRDVQIGGYDSPSHWTFFRKYYRHNSQGFRDVEHAPFKAPGTYRILVLGDSFTFGSGVRDIDDVYPRNLEAKLNALGSRVTFEVINASMKGWSTADEYEFFRTRGARYQPDLVVLGYFLNDAEFPVVKSERASLSRRWHLLPYPYGQLFYNFSFTYYLFERRVQSILPQLVYREEAEVEREWHDYREHIYTGENLRNYTKLFGEFLGVVRRRMGLPLVILLFPSLPHVYEEPYYYQYIHDYVEGMAAQHDVHFIDLLEPLRSSSLETLTVSAYDGHPNEGVHEIAAAELADLLVERGVVPVSP